MEERSAECCCRCEEGLLACTISKRDRGRGATCICIATCITFDLSTMRGSCECEVQVTCCSTRNAFSFGSLREFGEKVCFGSPTKHFVIFDLADMFRLDVKETPILRKIYVKYTSRKHQFDAESILLPVSHAMQKLSDKSLHRTAIALCACWHRRCQHYPSPPEQLLSVCACPWQLNRSVLRPSGIGVMALRGTFSCIMPPPKGFSCWTSQRVPPPTPRLTITNPLPSGRFMLGLKSADTRTCSPVLMMAGRMLLV